MLNGYRFWVDCIVKHFAAVLPQLLHQSDSAQEWRFTCCGP